MSELLLDVTQMREARAKVDRTFAADAIPPDAEVYRLVDAVVLAADIQRDKDQFRLVGKVRTTIELACGRCLEPFRMPVDERFDVLFLPHTDAPSDDEKKVEDDDLTTAFYSDHVINLGQLLQEQFYLAVPMKPLCRDDCRGLCSICGANLNTTTCACAESWQDPRLAPLRTLLKKDD
jgi:uncharacterized protein